MIKKRKRKNYEIEITERFKRNLIISAKSKEEALTKAKKKYENEEIILDSFDFIGTDFKFMR